MMNYENEAINALDRLMKAAEAKAQAAEEIKNEFPPAESPELVFGSDQNVEDTVQ